MHCTNSGVSNIQKEVAPWLRQATINATLEPEGWARGELKSPFTFFCRLMRHFHKTRVKLYSDPDSMYNEAHL